MCREGYTLLIVVKKVGVGILTSQRADLKARKVIREKVWRYIMIKRLILQEDITILFLMYVNFKIY